MENDIDLRAERARTDVRLQAIGVVEPGLAQDERVRNELLAEHLLVGITPAGAARAVPGKGFEVDQNERPDRTLEGSPVLPDLDPQLTPNTCDQH